MSVINSAGQEVQMPQDAEAFRHQLETTWAGENPHRWKQLAILHLIGNGWTTPNIAKALGLNRRHVYRVIANAKRGIYDFIAG